VIRLIDEADGDLDEAFTQIQAGVNDSASPIDFETYGDTFWEIFIAVSHSAVGRCASSGAAVVPLRC
jgi:hypothetical protein